MAIFVWGVIFVNALIPCLVAGAIIGLWLGKRGVALGFWIALLASFITSMVRNPATEFHRHAEDLFVYFPPFAAAMLLGWWLGWKIKCDLTVAKKGSIERK